MELGSWLIASCLGAIVTVITIALGIALAPFILPMLGVAIIVLIPVVILLIIGFLMVRSRLKKQDQIANVTQQESTNTPGGTVVSIDATKPANTTKNPSNVWFVVLAAVAIFLAIQVFTVPPSSPTTTDGNNSEFYDPRDASANADPSQDVCNSSQCPYLGGCVTRPTNSLCSAGTTGGWVCNSEFYEQNGYCVPYATDHNECGDADCDQAYANSVFDHYDKTAGSCVCDCKTGYQWNSGQTACVIPTPVVPVCTDSQCAFGGVCADRPANSKCATDGVNAWVCDEGFVKRDGQCV